MEPGRQAEARLRAAEPPALSLEQRADGTEVALRVEPGMPGQNRVVVGLRDADGSPVTDATRVGVRVFYLDGEIIEQTRFAIVQGEGLYAVDNVLLNLSGNWKAEVTVQRRSAFDLRTGFQFKLSSVPPPGPTTEWDLPTGRLVWIGQMVALGALLLVAGFLMSGRRLRNVPLEVERRGSSSSD